jgi:hypothetical protein
MFNFQTAKQFTYKAKEFKETGSILDCIRSSRCAEKKLNKTGARCDSSMRKSLAKFPQQMGGSASLQQM